jgi:hypothetical protein
MPSLNRITISLLYLMLLSPLLSYITFGLMGLRSITFYFTIFTFFYGFLFIIIKGKAIKIPSMIYLLILYSVFLSIWGFWNEGFERRGIFPVIMNRDITSVFFIIIIIYNTNFSERFIKRSILLIKITVIVAAIVSLIQVVDFSFMDSTPIWSKDKLRGTLLGDLYLDRRGSIFGYVNQNEMGLSYMLVAFILITFQILIVKKIKISGIFKYIIVITISGFVLIQILSYLGYDFTDWYKIRLFAEGSIQETTRYKAIENFLLFFPRNVFVGFGGVTDEITAASYAIGSSQIHVGYLAHLVYYGIIGSFFLFGFYFLLAKKLYKTAKLTNYWGSFFAFLVFLWANITLVYFSIFFYGITFALVFDKYFHDRYQFDNLHKKNIVVNEK